MDELSEHDASIAVVCLYRRVVRSQLVIQFPFRKTRFLINPKHFNCRFCNCNEASVMIMIMTIMEMII